MIRVNGLRTDEAMCEKWNQHLESDFVWVEMWDRSLLQNRQIVTTR